MARDRRGQCRGPAHHRPGALAADQRAARASSCRRTRSWAGRATRRSPVCRSRERLAELRQPEFRARILAEAFEGSRRAERASSAGTACIRSAIRRTTSPRPRAASPRGRRGEGARRRKWRTTCCSSATAEGILYLPVTNYAAGNLDVVREMIAAPNTLIGLGDGGAHVGIMCDATATSYTLTHWTRDRGRGALFPVAWGIKRLAADNAAAIGLQRPRPAAAGQEGRHQHPRLRQAATARARGRLRPAGGRQAAGPAHRRLRCDHRLRRRRLSPRRGDRRVARSPDPRRARGLNDSHEKGRHIMKAAYIEKFGGPEVLKYGDLPDPVAGRGRSWSTRWRRA